MLNLMGIKRNGTTSSETELRLSDVLSTQWGRRKYNEDDNLEGGLSKSISYEKVDSSFLGEEGDVNDSEVSLLSADGLITDDGMEGLGERVGKIVNDEYFNAGGGVLKETKFER